MGDCLESPFLPVYSQKYFFRQKSKRIPLDFLPLRHVRVICHKGVYLDYGKVRLVGRPLRPGEETLANNLYSTAL